MANIYVRSATGNDSNDGLSWVTAKATLMGAANIEVLGDVIYVANDHNEVNAAGQAIGLTGSGPFPLKIVCATPDATPPTTSATSAKISTTTGGINITGPCYMYGFEFSAGSGGTAANIGLNNSSSVEGLQGFEKCKFIIGNTSSSSNITFGSTTSSSSSVQYASLKNCDLKWAGNATDAVVVNGNIDWEGGSVLEGSVTPTTGIFSMGLKGGNLVISGFDFSALSSTVNLTRFSTRSGTVTFRNCKLPMNWTGSLTNAQILRPGQRAVMVNCDSGDTNYKFQQVEMSGSLTTDTSVIRTGGATDGVTPISWKLVSNANAGFPVWPLVSAEIIRWFPATDAGEVLGNSVTVGVEIISDSPSNLTNDEIWVEAQMFATNGTPLGTYFSNRKSDILGTSAAQITSTQVWTAPSLATPKRQTLQVSTIIREAGWISLKVYLAKPNTTVYVCPKVRVT